MPRAAQFHVFRSMLSALAYVVGADADHYFTLHENRRHIDDCLAGLVPLDETDTPDSLKPQIVDSLAEYAADTGRCDGCVVSNETHLGVILAHYTDAGDIVRFLAMKA